MRGRKSPFLAAGLEVSPAFHACINLSHMRSLWDRIRTGHVTFVTTGYLRIMEPIATVLIKLGISANALTTIGTLSTVVGGVAFAYGHMRAAGFIIGLTAIADALDGVVARRTNT